MGRPKKPTELKIIQGSRDRDKEKGKDLMESETAPSVNEIDLDLLCVLGQKYFNSLYKKLHKADVLKETDIDNLIILADSYAQYWNAHIDVQENGYTVITKKGIVKNPSLTIKHQAFERIKTLQGQYGLTPATRPNIEKNGDGGNGEDPLGDALGFS